MKASKTPPLELLPTGDSALDSILGGGLPARSLVTIGGEPGSGKTMLTLQMLFAAARRGEKSLYFTTLSEPAIKVIRYMQKFEFFDPDLLDKNVIFADLAAAGRQGAERTLAELESRIAKHAPTLIAIDSFRALGELLGVDLRAFVYDLAVSMASSGATTLLVGEYARDEVTTLPEFVVADGILRLATERRELTSTREIEVVKLRGTAHLSGRHFFDIGAHGLTFYPRVSAPVEVDRGAAASVRANAPDDRASTGVEGLDELFAGGLPRNSATLIQGSTGTGKTLLSLQFLIDGAKRGEKGVFFTLEESAEQLRSHAEGLGWDLARLEEAGLIVIKYSSPVELSTDRFLYEARTEAAALGATRAVFDSLTTMALGVQSDRRFKEMAYAIAKHMRGQGVTLAMTLEAEQLMGAATIGSQGVSFIADNLVQLRYVEIEGRLERAISVIKARGVQHASELRSMIISKGGIRVVAGRFKEMRGVLTGLPAHDPRPKS
ncbi:MAG: putative circadian clock protein KaiC [Myxococcaceae bacterium]|nr:putative circadian clock protein KaiC [Myxococcaceae bacterium]